MKKTYKRLLWIRTESRSFEERAPLSPKACRTLIKLGHKVVVEASKSRIFKDSEYQEAGCELTPANSWIMAPTDAFILGLEPLTGENFPLNHRHIYSSQAYYSGSDSTPLFKRFMLGGGKLYDLDKLVDKKGSKVASFDYWDGVMAAGLSLKYWAFKKLNLNPKDLAPLLPENELKDFIDKIGGYLDLVGSFPKIFIQNHKNERGRGAQFLLRKLGAQFRPLEEDLLLTITEDQPLHLHQSKLSADLDFLEAKSLSSYLPKTSSESFSTELLPFMIDLLQAEIEDTAWERSLSAFYKEIERLELFPATSPVMAQNQDDSAINLH
ncbi:MAG: saccharopine dehydrogenase (NAD+, L-lysine-forming) [Bacteriovoracaceae bacterium]|jgi:saccharopine dehydrogenase (NAD+, L-lysine-forming)